MILSFPFASFLAFFSLSFLSLCSSLCSDGLSLLALKAAIETDPSHVLDSWSESDSTPCHWPGIQCTRDRVTQLSLPNKGFTGYIPSELGLLNSLRRLSLAFNNFSKPIPSHLYNATNLIVLDLSHNSLSGPVSDQIKNLSKLRHLDLSSNFLNGSLPETLSLLPELVGTLNLSYNQFSGEVPASYGNLPLIVNLDLRHNNLTGKIPQIGSLLNQGPTAFSGNPSLCGFPLQTQCPEAQNPNNVFPSSENPQNPKSLNPNFPNLGENRARERTIGSATIPIVSAVFVVIGAVSLSVWWFRKKPGSTEGETGKQKEIIECGEIDVEGQQGKFAVIDEGMNLELEDLLRASAYVVGKSRSGIVYKVVAGRGSGAVATIVAVRRLNDGDATLTFKDFEYEMESIGKVHHPNIVRLRAYYYASDEKLLISDFIKNGSLHTALHGGPSSSLSPLSWSTRLKIAQGAARGLAYIHEFGARKYVHGNIKSTKILLDDDLESYVSGFGLNRLSPGTTKFTATSSKKQNSNNTMITSIMGPNITTPSAMYLAPEVRESGGKCTQKCDVYAFGIVLLELLTGRLPDAGTENDGKGLESFVRRAFREERPLTEIIDPTLVPEIQAKKQVVSTFHIALNCTELDPELRPRMRTVSESLDRIKSQ